MASVRDNLLTSAQRQFDHAADLLHLDTGLRQILRIPQRELCVHFPVKMDDGSMQVIDTPSTGLSNGDRVELTREGFIRRIPS